MKTKAMAGSIGQIWQLCWRRRTMPSGRDWLGLGSEQEGNKLVALPAAPHERGDTVATMIVSNGTAWLK
jgi:hypothetical protein